MQTFAGYKMGFEDESPKYTVRRIKHHSESGLFFNSYKDNQKDDLYFEIEVIKGDGEVRIGILSSCAAILAGWKGLEDNDWGCRCFYSLRPFTANNCKSVVVNMDIIKFGVNGSQSSEQSTAVNGINDVIGCGMMAGHQGYVYFTLNGKKMQKTMKYDGCRGVFPILQILGAGTEINMTMSGKFLFNPNAANPSRLPISKSFSEEWTKQIDCVSNLTENLILDHLMDVKIIPKDGGELKCHDSKHPITGFQGNA